jgi:hypothetical protein
MDEGVTGSPPTIVRCGRCGHVAHGRQECGRPTMFTGRCQCQILATPAGQVPKGSAAPVSKVFDPKDEADRKVVVRAKRHIIGVAVQDRRRVAMCALCGHRSDDETRHGDDGHKPIIVMEDDSVPSSHELMARGAPRPIAFGRKVTG